MQTRKPLIPAQILIAIGLLFVSLPAIINNYLGIPDFLRGSLMGIGLGLEIIAVFLLNRKKRSAIDSKASSL